MSTPDPSARAHLDALLARILLEEPDAELHLALRAPDIAAVLGEIDPELAGWLDAPWSEAKAEEAREEFTRLFLLPAGAPPFASAWLEGERERLGAGIVAFVQSVLGALGREPARREPWGNVPLDHLGLLFELAAQAATSADAAQNEVGARLRAELLGEWVGSFGAALEQKAKLPLYRATGRLLVALHA